MQIKYWSVRCKFINNLGGASSGNEIRAHCLRLLLWGVPLLLKSACDLFSSLPSSSDVLIQFPFCSRFLSFSLHLYFVSLVSLVCLSILSYYSLLCLYPIGLFESKTSGQASASVSCSMQVVKCCFGLSIYLGQLLGLLTMLTLLALWLRQSPPMSR